MTNNSTIPDKSILSFNELWQQAEVQLQTEQDILSPNQYVSNRNIKLGHKLGRGHKQSQLRRQIVFEYTSLKSNGYRKKLKQRRGPLCGCCHNGPNSVFFHINENKRDDRPANLLLLCRQCHVNLRLQRFCIFPKRGILSI